MTRLEGRERRDAGPSFRTLSTESPAPRGKVFKSREKPALLGETDGPDGALGDWLTGNFIVMEIIFFYTGGVHVGVARTALIALEVLAFSLFLGAMALQHPITSLTTGPQLGILAVGVGVLLIAMVITDVVVG